MTEGIRLKKIEVSGFRGINKLLSFNMDHNSILLFGSNGTGKSTLLDAIEFAFFGWIQHFHGEEFTLTRDELVNDFCEKGVATVKVDFSDSNIGYHVSRDKKLRRKKTPLILKTEKAEYPQTKAQQLIDVLLGLDVRDFYSSVYLHQDLLNDIIMGAPDERARALDSLLGLTEINDILGAIPLGRAEATIEKLRNKLKEVDREKIGALRILRRDLKKLEAELRDSGKFDMPSPHTAILAYKRITSKLHSLADEKGVARKRIAPLDDINEESKKKTRSLQKYSLYILKERSPRETEHHMLLRDAENKIAFVNSIEKRLRKTAKKVKRLTDKFGKIREIRAEIKKTKKKLKDVKKRNERVSRIFSMLESGLALVLESALDECPLCKLRYDRNELAEHIKFELRELRRTQEAKKLSKEVDSFSLRIGELEHVLKESIRLQNEIESIRSELRVELSEIAPKADIDVEIEDFDFEQLLVWISVVRNSLNSLRNTLENISGEYNKAWETRVSKMESEIDELTTMVNYIQKKEELDSLEKIIPEVIKERKRFEKSLKKVERYHLDLTTLSSALEEGRIRAARTILERLIPEMNRVYSKFQPRFHYDQLEIRLGRGRGRRGKREHTYKIQAVSSEYHKRTFVKTKFSTAQRNVAALSIFFSLVLGATHNVNFIIIDEPDQSLDRQHKENLADLLRELQGFKQVIVSTQDEEFQEILIDRMMPPEGGSRVIYRFKDWKPREGPLVEKSVQKGPVIFG